MDDKRAKTKMLDAIFIPLLASENNKFFIFSLSNKSNIFAFPCIKSFIYDFKLMFFITSSSFTYFSISSIFILLS